MDYTKFRKRYHRLPRTDTLVAEGFDNVYRATDILHGYLHLVVFETAGVSSGRIAALQREVEPNYYHRRTPARLVCAAGF